MIWQEALIDRTLDDEQVAQAVTRLLPLDRSDVLVVRDLAAADVSERVRLICELTPMRGEFPLRVSFYMRDSTLESADSLQFIERFCELLGCRCLVSDDSEDPYTMLLVEGPGKETAVSLDVELLDDREEYAVQHPN